MVPSRSFPRNRRSTLLTGLPVLALLAAATGPPAAASPGCVPAPSGLVSLWPGEGNALDIVGPNSGTIVGNVTFQPLVVGQAFRFERLGQIEIADNPTLHPTTGASFAFWFTIAPLDGAFHGFFGKRETSLPLPTTYGSNFCDAFYPLGVYYDDPNVHYPANQSDDQNHIEVSRTSMPSVNQTQFFAATWEQAGDEIYVRTYLNGSLVKFKAMPGHLSDCGNTVPLVLGATLTGFYEGLNGTMDEVMLYDRAIRPSTIQRIYNAGAAGLCSSQLLPSFSVDAASEIAGAAGAGPWELTATIGSGTGRRRPNPAREDLTVVIGDFRQVLPAGSITCGRGRTCSYTGAPGAGIESVAFSGDVMTLRVDGPVMAASISGAAGAPLPLIIRLGRTYGGGTVTFASNP